MGRQRKINAIYDHGVKELKRQHPYTRGCSYSSLYNGGLQGRKYYRFCRGVEVVVPFHMKYYDPTSKPPLKIDIKEGKQTLNGKKS